MKDLPFNPEGWPLDAQGKPFNPIGDAFKQAEQGAFERKLAFTRAVTAAAMGQVEIFEGKVPSADEFQKFGSRQIYTKENNPEFPLFSKIKNLVEVEHFVWKGFVIVEVQIKKSGKYKIVVVKDENKTNPA